MLTLLIELGLVGAASGLDGDRRSAAERSSSSSPPSTDLGFDLAGHLMADLPLGFRRSHSSEVETSSALAAFQNLEILEEKRRPIRNSASKFVSALKRSYRVPAFSLFDVELPLAFRARWAGAYTDTPFRVDAMAYDRRNRLGPALRTNHFFESRLSIGHAVRPGVEFEVAWSSQSLVSVSDGPTFDRQVVGAFLRVSR